MGFRYVPVAELDELAESKMKVVKVEWRYVIVTLLDGQPIAFERNCPHEGGLLEQGVILQGSVYCDDHGWAFDVRTGACTQPSSSGPSLARFPGRGARREMVRSAGRLRRWITHRYRRTTEPPCPRVSDPTEVTDSRARRPLYARPR